MKRGPGDRILRSLRSGVYAYLILEMLSSSGPLHGYLILRRLEEAGEGVLRPSESTVYETLRKLEKMGLVEAEWVIPEGGGPPRRVYRITEKGAEELERIRGEARSIAKLLGCS